jgi:hypothetical protein
MCKWSSAVGVNDNPYSLNVNRQQDPGTGSRQLMLARRAAATTDEQQAGHRDFHLRSHHYTSPPAELTRLHRT